MVDARRVENLIRQARALVEGQQAEEALARFGEALALAPTRLDLLLEKGVAEFRLGRLEAAAATFGEVRQRDPQQAVAYHNEAKALLACQRPEEALQVYQAALTALPERYRTLVLLGNLLREQGRCEEALEALDEATQLRPRDPDAFLAAGQTLREAGHLEQALQNLLWCQGLVPTDPELCYQLGLCLAESGYLEEGIDSLARAVRRAPERIELLVSLARVLNDAGHPLDAVDCATRALALDGSCDQAWREQGRAELTLGEQPARARLHLGRAQRLAGRPEEALAELDQALALEPQLDEAWNERAEALLALARPEEAKEAYRRSLAAHPGGVAVHLALGRLLWEQPAQQDEALACFRRAVQIEVGRYFELPAEIRAALDRS